MRRLKRRLSKALAGALLAVPIACAAHAAASTDPLAPKIFNAPVQAANGDIVSIQGANFDASTVVYLQSGAVTAPTLQIVNRVTDKQVSVQLPASLPSPLSIRLQNSHGSSDTIVLNASLPRHLDTTQLTPGARFRLFGLNLKLPGFTPTIRINGQLAQVDANASNINMLVATVPPSAAPGASADILSDNGNGSGANRLAVTVPVVAGYGDPLGLAVGWAAGFTFANHVIQAHPVCNGSTDDTWAIESAIVQVKNDGGGVVQLPAGTCRIAHTVDLGSRVILRGAGQDATILRYEGNYPVYAEGFDLVGLQDLQLLNAGPVQEGAIWRNNTRSFIRRVTIRMGVSRQWFLTANRDFLFSQNVIEQTGSYNAQNPYRFDNSSGLLFANNVSTNAAGSPTFQFVHDAAFLNNRFTRNAASQFERPVVAHHRFVADFSARITIMGNTFDVINGPVTNTLRNDGETILVEGGGANRTENLGSVTAATGTTLTDQANTINVNPFGTGLPENYGVAIVSGPGAGQVRRVTGYAGKTLTVDRAWDMVPGAGSHYSTFVWAFQDVQIINNVLSDNPRGIWLYQCSVNRVTIIGNTIKQGGGIFLRSYQNLAQKIFTVQANVLVSSNHITNSTGRWMSYITLANVSSDTAPFGTGEIGIEVRRNTIVANTPNVTSNVEDYAAREGYAALMHIEPSGGQLNADPNIVGTVFQNNTCQNCASAFAVGTGDFGTIVADNAPNVRSGNALLNLMMLGQRFGASSGTFVR